MKYAVAFLLFVGCLYAQSRSVSWRGFFKYDGEAKDVYDVEHAAFLPMRPLWLLVDQDAGARPELKSFLDCKVSSRVREGLTEIILTCGDAVFAVKGLAGAQ